MKKAKSQHLYLPFEYTAKNTVISPDFLGRKFCGKAQFSHSFRPKLGRNCAFLQNFHSRKSGEITVFFPVIIVKIKESGSLVLLEK